MWEHNNVLIYTLIRLKFPERDYDRYRQKLDCRYIEYRSDQHLVGAWLVVPRHGPDGDANAATGEAGLRSSSATAAATAVMAR